MTDPRHDALAAAAQQRSRDTRQRAVTTIRRLDKEGLPLTMTTVAQAAGVSRSWLYRQTDLHFEIARHRHPAPSLPRLERAGTNSQHQRIENMHDEIRQLNAEILSLRQQLAQHFGQQRADQVAT
jgi:AraC-like DNA-binding protein